MRRSDEVSEAELARAWAERLYDDESLVDSLGRRIQVVFPGRRWGGPGPDFQGAVLALPDGALLRGDVEVHRRASGWLQHGHSADPAYARVVLHVVQVADAVILDAIGRPLPTVQLQPAGIIPLPVLSPCLHTEADVLAAVEAAGRARFHAHAARFEGELSVRSAAVDVLWRGVAEALGYSHNTSAMGQLAEALPWSEATWLLRREREAGLAAALLGVSGLLPYASPDEQTCWDQLVVREPSLRQVLPTTCWSVLGTRLANHPAQRCRGLARLAARWTAHFGADDVVEGMLEVVRQAAGERKPRLWDLLLAVPYVGRGRATVAAINVLLPFAYAAGVEEAAQLYERLPGEPMNRVTAYMAAQLGTPGLRFRTACQQQGLLALFKDHCGARVCERCPAAAHSTRAASEG